MVEEAWAGRGLTGLEGGGCLDSTTTITAAVVKTAAAVQQPESNQTDVLEER